MYSILQSLSPVMQSKDILSIGELYTDWLCGYDYRLCGYDYRSDKAPLATYIARRT